MLRREVVLQHMHSPAKLLHCRIVTSAARLPAGAATCTLNPAALPGFTEIPSCRPAIDGAPESAAMRDCDPAVRNVTPATVWIPWAPAKETGEGTVATGSVDVSWTVPP